MCKIYILKAIKYFREKCKRPKQMARYSMFWIGRQYFKDVNFP